MAINPSTQYPGKIDNTDANYPYGKAQNITTPGDGTGTPWEKAIVNDVLGFQQALLASSGIVPSAAADKVTASQYTQSIVEIAGGRAMSGTVGGTANAITLTVKANQEPPKSLFVGMRLLFDPNNNSTAAATVNPFGLGVTPITLKGGVPTLGGEIRNNRPVELLYDGVNFRIISEIMTQNLITNAGVLAGGGGGVITSSGIFVSGNIEIGINCHGDSAVGQNALLVSAIVRTNSGKMVGYDPAGIGLPVLAGAPTLPGSFGYLYKNGASVTQNIQLDIFWRLNQ